jgi:hypothetical protein
MEHWLGRNPSPFDERDYQLKNFLAVKKLVTAGSKAWPFPSEPLNQGETPHCVGFAMANWGINLPIQDNFNNDNGHDFYYRCKVLDNEPNVENGTNVRSAAKVLKQSGLIGTYAFAGSTDEISYWLLNNGPVIVGTIWTEGMFKPDENNVIHPTGTVVGGHGYLINEKTNSDYYGIQNSWDDSWGIKGKAYISISDFAKMLRNGGEAIATMELEVPNTLNDNKGCEGLIQEFINLFKRS